MIHPYEQNARWFICFRSAFGSLNDKGIHHRLRLPDCRVRTEPRDGAEYRGLAPAAGFLASKWKPVVDVGAEKLEFVRHHTDNGGELSINANRHFQNIGSSAKAALPQTMADYRNATRGFRFIALR